MKIKFLPQNITVEGEPGKSLMECARENNLPISSSCNGRGICAECRVHIKEGEENTLPPSEKEITLIGGGCFIDRRRLSCQLFCFGPAVIDLSEQVARQKYQGGLKKQFLEKINKKSLEESAAEGGVFLEQDQDIQKISQKLKTQETSPASKTFKNSVQNRDRRGRRKRKFHSFRRRGKKKF